uniref:RNA dependent RNA polymerase n=1 Tax=Xinjiang mito-like virus 43 TaxID=2937189 RepID=A0A9Y1CSN8_9VIRU|nr:MAG: putative RNA dependent RNA polymerase [Xinjiang mito-like virus 43]
MTWPLLNVIRSFRGNLTSALVRSTWVLLRSLDAIRQKNGLSFAAQYMKACALYVMQYVGHGGHQPFLHSTTYGPHVALSHSGLPRILPMWFRVGLRSRDPIVVKTVLSIFNLYRVIPYPGKLKLNSITDSWAGGLTSGIIGFIPIFWKLLPSKAKGGFEWTWNPFPILARGATSPKGANSNAGFFLALVALRGHESLWKSLCWFFTEAPQSYIGVPVGRVLLSLTKLADELRSHCDLTVIRGIPLGRLAFKEEPGKIRVFAIVDPITQWLLKPLHDWLFAVLRDIPQDGTFDQDQAVSTVIEKVRKGALDVFSFDLSSATDRLPILLQAKILNHCVPDLGTVWSTLLTARKYVVPLKYGNTIPEVKYATGQPMGALSSWAMLALTHHFLVQYSAWLAGKRKWFTEYMILGDDLLILDSGVAKCYLDVMRQLGVGVNLAKSLVSNKGYGEFAKKFFGPDGIMSGISLKEWSSFGENLAGFFAYFRRLNMTLPIFLRTLGFGSFSSGHQIDWGRHSYKTLMGLVAMFPQFGTDSDPTLPIWWSRFYAFKIPWYEECWRSLFVSSVSVRASRFLAAYSAIGETTVADSYSRWGTLVKYWLSTLPLGGSSPFELREIVALVWYVTTMTDLGVSVLTGSSESEIRHAEDMASDILRGNALDIHESQVDRWLELLLWDPREMSDAAKWSRKWSLENFTRVVANEQGRRASTVAELYKPLSFSQSLGKKLKELPWG